MTDATLSHEQALKVVELVRDGIEAGFASDGGGRVSVATLHEVFKTAIETVRFVADPAGSRD